MGTERLFSDHGELSKVLPNFELRDEQLKLANAILTAIEQKNHLIAEAGTGIGKTFAYLLPAMASKKRTFVSTATKHLQDQVFFKDIPVIEKVLERKITACLLKGRSNYLCHHRFYMLESSSASITAKQLRSLEKIRKWKDRTLSGDLSEVTEFGDQDAAFVKQITSTVDNCLGQECEYFSKCFIQKVRDKAKKSELVVINHALLLADIIIKETGFAEILPDVDVVMIDEAHHLAKIATSAFAEQVTSNQLIELTKDMRSIYQSDSLGEDDFLTEFIETVELFIDQMPTDVGDQKISLRDIRKYPSLYKGFKQLMQEFKVILDELDQIKEKSIEIENLYDRAVLIAKRIKYIFTIQDQDEAGEKEHSVGLLIWGNNFFHAVKMPIHLGNRFQYIMQDYADSWVFVSATLCVGESFSYYKKELGLPEDIPDLLIKSPFDYEKNCKIHVLEKMPEPKSPEFTKNLIRSSIPIIKAVGGRTFLLFTSYKALYEAAKLLKKESFHLFVQGDAPKSKLIHQFMEKENAVLLGTVSFWEGVDVQGEKLSCVIIDKIPFPSPGDPFVSEQIRYLEANQINSFVNCFIPKAVTLLKQGAGRLIRGKTDKGVLIFGDPRLITKGYGKQLLDSLPSASRVGYDELIQFIKTEL